jgi:flagellar biogenesis protein FliO
LANSPLRKRAVAASRTVAEETKQRPPTRVRRPAPILDDDAPSENYALRLTEALDAISSVQDGRTPGPSAAPAKKQPPPRAPRVSTPSSVFERNAPSGRSRFSLWLMTLDKLPPIRLPIGPAIPWRLGLPALVGVVALVFVMSRPSGHVDAQPVRLPAQDTYAVQQDAPLFANSQQAQAPAPAAQTAPALGVPEPSSLAFDAADIGFKLIAVLALAYGSLLLLKRAGFGGAAAARTGGTPGIRVVSSLSLAPNRSVHVLKVPGGKTLLVGATPNQVNLIADLGDIAEEESPDATSFFDVLKGKL